VLRREAQSLSNETDVQAREAVERLVANVGQAIRGKDPVIRLVVTALLARGHVLIEDVPGVGKTTLAWALARSVGGSFHRIQFTSDLLPSDVIGVNLWNHDERRFEFRKGPLFAHLVLADEINRTTPKTQSALLEAMSEGTVTVDDLVHELPDPFFVIATQNPVDHSGTFPLPDSQLDRFLLRTRMGYPAAADELAILRAGGRRTGDGVHAVLSLEELRDLRRQVEQVHVDDDLAGYLVEIVSRTRSWESVEVGASPRASVDLFRAAQAHALMEGRDHVVPDDIRRLAVPVLAHRIVPREARGNPRRVETLLSALVDAVPVPA
jgi:MoxR-like ATPase